MELIVDFLFEFVFDVLLEIGVEASKSRRLPKWLRYLLIAVIALFLMAVVGMVVIAGVLMMQESMVIGLLLILAGIFLLGACIVLLRKNYLKRK